MLSPFFLFLPRRAESRIYRLDLSNVQREEGLFLERSGWEEYLNICLLWQSEH